MVQFWKIIDTLEYLENIQDEIAEISEELIETYYSDSELLINFLQGLCKGLIADGRIEQEEIECLYNYLVDYSGYLSREPMCQIFYETFKDVDLDNISSNQKAKIKALITDFSGCDNQGSVDGLSIGSSFFDTVEGLDLSGKIIQLTGRFKYGTRSKCKALAESQGAIVLDDWRMDIDYLIVGNSNSRDWIYQSYGRKIERAKEYQVKQNHKVKIITEEQWIVEV
ncbi:BRCT domain-containing protein [Muribacter muris]|uniref:BRCT domain-containing protein n=1 Tax=Muribacter muris TaxID=67855 RepID=UPI00069D9C10|nr:BRCT domain-containing protein [Muribacter muris]